MTSSSSAGVGSRSPAVSDGHIDNRYRASSRRRRGIYYRDRDYCKYQQTQRHRYIIQLIDVHLAAL